jgi:hypothetical protein
MKLAESKKHPLKISWSIGDGYGDPWNEICARVVEKFGLPGDRYTTEISSNWMIFYFREAEDLLMAKLSLGDVSGY